MLGVDILKKNLLSKAILFLFAFVLLFTAECVMNGIIYKTFFVKYPMLELSGIVMALAPLFIFKKQRNANIYTSIIYVLLNTIMLVNLLLDFNSGDIFSLKYIFLAGEAAKVFSLQFIHFGYVAIYIAYLALYFVGLRVINNLVLKNHEYNYSYHQLGYSIFFILIIASTFMKLPSLSSIENDTMNKIIYKNKSAKEIINYSTNYLKKSSLKNYGLITYNLAEIDNLVEFNSTSKTAKLDKFFDSGVELKKNDFTGSLEGMNVLTIMVETGVLHEDDSKGLKDSMSAFVTEEFTPNLYKLFNNGVMFNNNHSKNKTNISELIGILGSTSEGAKSQGYVAPYALPEVLKNLGYNTSFFHDNRSSFYNRNVIIPSLGFENSYFIDDINPEDAFLVFDGNYPLDSKFVEKAVDYMVPKGPEPFYTFWTTLSTHGPYNTGKTNMKYFQDMGYYSKILAAEENGSWINPVSYMDDCEEKTEILNQVRNYQAEMMDLDRGIGIILDRLEETGKLDDTLIVIYGDHEMYYRSNGYSPIKNYIYNNDEVSYSPQYETMMLFSNPKLNKLFEEEYGSRSVKEFTSPYMIVPTILELLGIDYNTNHYFGRSFFQIDSELDNIFYSHELKVLFTDKVYAYELPALEYVEDGTNNAYLEHFLAQALVSLDRVEMFNDMYRLDYFKDKLEGK